MELGTSAAISAMNRCCSGRWGGQYLVIYLPETEPLKIVRICAAPATRRMNFNSASGLSDNKTGYIISLTRPTPNVVARIRRHAAEFSGYANNSAVYGKQVLSPQ